MPAVAMVSPGLTKLLISLVSVSHSSPSAPVKALSGWTTVPLKRAESIS